jgi:hypothetical protein
MALPANLVTNEVKNSSGTEVEFARIGPSPTNPNSLRFAFVSEAPAYPQRILFSHQEIGDGIKRRRRSLMRVDYSLLGMIDTTSIEKVSAQLVLDSPVGNLTSNATPTNVLAYLMSLLASQGANTTILYDGTGYGAAALLSGTL